VGSGAEPYPKLDTMHFVCTSINLDAGGSICKRLFQTNKIDFELWLYLTHASSYTSASYCAKMSATVRQILFIQSSEKLNRRHTFLYRALHCTFIRYNVESVNFNNTATPSVSGVGPIYCANIKG